LMSSTDFPFNNSCLEYQVPKFTCLTLTSQFFVAYNQDDS
jgi:hypothetical protein